MRISAKTKICMIIGNPILHSLSPAMHNAAYEKLGLDDRFVFVAADVKPSEVQDVVRSVRVLGIHGLTCTAPHKIEVMKYLDEVDQIAKRIGAVNTVLNKNGKLIGFNTDWIGTVAPLEELIDLKGKKVALIGAGGASRAMAYGVLSRGAKLTIYNRTVEKAKEIAVEFDCEFSSLENSQDIRNADVIINSTTVGMGEGNDKMPINPELIHSGQIVFDAIYDPFETKLLKLAKENGAKVINGLEMLLHQGTAQFEIYTGEKAPIDTMREILMDSVYR
ncbi:MAG TPA: shikimate dehydrogenase [Candidatus Dojkabacteria bacterium]